MALNIKLPETYMLICYMTPVLFTIFNAKYLLEVQISFDCSQVFELE